MNYGGYDVPNDPKGYDCEEVVSGWPVVKDGINATTRTHRPRTCRMLGTTSDKGYALGVVRGR